MTADQAPVLWPWVASPALPPTGAQMGMDLFSGGSFYCDPNGWVLDPEMAVSNPNVFCFGKPGTGKSATVKAFCLRMTDFGYRILVVGDPKDEYEILCRTLGVEPIAIGHGLPARINPLTLGPLGAGWEQLDATEARRRVTVIFSRWLTLLRGLIGSQTIGQQPVPFGPTEEAVLDTALRLLTGHQTGNTRLVETTIPAVWRLLDEPPASLVEGCRFASVRQFMDDTRLLRDCLGQLVNGSLRGLFDAHTTIRLDWDAPIQSLSLSRLEALGDQAVGMALLCLNSWGRAMREVAEPGDLRIVVRDESWKQLRLGVEAVKSFDADLRLSRRDGDIQFAIAHKPSDLLTAGDAGSQATAIAKDLLHLADTRIVHGQDQKVAEELETLLGLPPAATGLVTDWCRQAPGRALWLVGDQIHKVVTVLHPAERAIAWTQQALEKAR
ncbi:MAG: ATP-binding protein [Micropruina sp.]|uniref:ATP-binding protein n=1 Tax=Micropruina sp. TaxID=2737536 RepID=UPI0039E6653F